MIEKLFFFIILKIYIYICVLSKKKQVLSFKMLWNDTSLEGGLNLFTLNYFLADDTVEIKEIRK